MPKEEITPPTDLHKVAELNRKRRGEIRMGEMERYDIITHNVNSPLWN